MKSRKNNQVKKYEPNLQQVVHNVCGQTFLLDIKSEEEVALHFRDDIESCPVCRGRFKLNLNVAYHEKICGCISIYPMNDTKIEVYDCLINQSDFNQFK